MRARKSLRDRWQKLRRIRRSSKYSSEARMQPEDRPKSLLDVTGLTAGYGGIQVLWGVDLLVREHESVVLLGANGAGKTTLLKTLMGLMDAWAGQTNFDGEDITRLRTDHRVRRGIVYMSEASGFVGLTVEENILIGA